MRTLTLLLAGLALAVAPQFAYGQVGGGGGVAGGGGGIGPQTGQVPDRNAGLTQSGQISSDAGIVREEGAFIGRGGTEHPRSVAQFNTTSVNSGFAQTSAAGVNLGITGTGGQNNLLGAAALGGGRNNFNQALGLNNAFNNRGGNQGNQFGLNNTQGTQAPIRYQLRYAEAVPSRPYPTAAVAASTNFRRVLSRTPVLSNNESVNLLMDGRTLVLRGTVATERERKLMARMAELEPGVSFVRNELRLASEAVSTAEPQGPAILTSP